MPDIEISGTVVKGWESIREVFAENFTPTENDAGDLGAGLCVIADGEMVVDLTGGWRDRTMRQAFTPETLVNSYSVGKGITAVMALIAASRGLIDLDAPVNRHWRAFAQDSTLRQHLSHQAGLPALRGVVDESVPTDWARMCEALAATEPWWQPGTAHGYHVNTAGFLVGEPLRLAAGAGRFSDLAGEWLAGLTGAEMFFGVPEPALARCSEIDFTEGRVPPAPAGADDFPDEASRMRHHAYLNPSTVSGVGIIETDVWRQAEVPSTNIHTTAKAVASVYAALLDPDGPVDPALVVEAATTQVDGDDLVLETRSRFGLGFQLHQDDRPIGVSPASFGHYGFGGSIGFVDPDADLAVGYVLNRPGDRWQVPRTKRLLAALRDRLR